MSQLRIPFPIKGISDALSNQDQTPETTRIAQNMRGRDPLTGRYRGAQRAGISKFVDTQINASHLQDVAGLVYDRNLANYSVATSPAIEWERTNDADDTTTDIAVTAGGDIYILAGAGVLQKINANSDEILKVQLPLEDNSEEAVAVVVDALGFVYVSTEVAPDDNTYDGRIFCFQPSLDVDDQLDLWWTYEAEGRVSDIKEFQGTLFAVVNKEDMSELVALNSLSSSTPNERWRRPIAKVSGQLAINSSGDPIVSAPPLVDRDAVDVGTFCATPETVSWTPDDATGSVHCWLDAAWIPDKSDLETVDFWLDRSGNNRNAFKGGDMLGGKFLSNALCGFPGVRFDAQKVNGKSPGLKSNDNDLKFLPNSNDARIMAMLIKTRPALEGNGSEDTGKLIEDGIAPKFRIFQDETGLEFYVKQAFPPMKDNTGTDFADVSVEETNTSEAIDNEENVALIVWAIDPKGDREGSFFRVNGSTVHQLTHQGAKGGGNTRFAQSLDTAHMGNFDLMEFVVLRGDYQWPTDFETVPVGTGAGQDGIDYVADPDEWDGEPAAVDYGDQATISDIEKVEAYLAFKFGLQATLLPADHPFGTDHIDAPPTGAGDDTPPTVDPNLAILKSPDGVVAKFNNADGSLKWAYSGAGVGYGVAVGLDPDDDGVYTTGPTVASPADSTTARRLVDEGFEVSDDGADGAWTRDDSELVGTNARQRITVDKAKNVYIPVSDLGSHLIKLDGADTDQSGAFEFEFTIPSVTLGGLVVVPDTGNTDYGDDSIQEPEFVYLGGFPSAQGTGTNTLYKLRLVNASISIGAPRGIRTIAVCDGNIRRMERGEVTDVVTVTGGSGALNSDSRIVYSIQAQGRLYYTDGEQYKKYDPVADEVTEWKAVGAGSLPIRARLLEYWRGRVLLARTQGDSSNIFMSEVGNPEGYDLFPPVVTQTQAVSLSASSAGAVPDIVNGMIPYSDDLLIIGGDHSMWRLTGDPAYGGKIDLISDMTGMAFGRAWCKDPEGRVYFFGSRGGVYRMSGANAPEKISSPRLDRRLETINFEYYTARLVYSTEDRGVHVFFVPVDVVDAVLGPGIVTTSPSQILDDQNVTVYYQSQYSYLTLASPVYMRYAFDGGSTTDVAMTDPGGNGVWEATIAVPDGALELGVIFNDGIVTITDDNDGDEWSFPIVDSDDPTPDYGNGGPFGGSGIGDGIGVDSEPAGQAATGRPLTHYFYEVDTDAWWADKFAAEDFDPTAVAVVDGDEVDDRRVLIGGRDGYVRMMDKDSANDDSLAIDAYVRIGPIRPNNQMRQFRFYDFETTLAADDGQSGCAASLFAGDSAEPQDTEIANMLLVAGRNQSWLKKVKGQSVFYQLRNSAVDERFSVEAMACAYADAGGV